ncbi:MAG: hypothetical protein C0392_14855 [Syntrophus sp. (in: bacteria)]|nr:hypothetical protein [Syntrophus sp. (in: bacteria)]
MKKITIYILTAFFLVASGTVVQGAEEQKLDGKALFEGKCAICHKLDRTTSKKKTPADWEKTVLRMKKKNPEKAPISVMEAKAIIDYLAQNHGKTGK